MKKSRISHIIALFLIAVSLSFNVGCRQNLLNDSFLEHLGGNSSAEEVLPENHKRCTKCKTILDIHHFPRRRNGRYDSWCRECYRIYKRKKEDKIREDKIREDKIREDKIREKKCSVCKKNKPIEMFWKSKRCKDGYNGRCIECIQKKNKISKIERLKERGW